MTANRKLSPRSRPSDQICDRYHVVLDDAMRDWFDGFLQDAESSCNAADIGIAGDIVSPLHFVSPATSDQLLRPAPTVIWGGLMPPDLLPVLGNEYGDWIAARIGGGAAFDADALRIPVAWMDCNSADSDAYASLKNPPPSGERIIEFVYWYHGGGDWIPWGQTLPQAIAFSVLRRMGFQHGREIAIDADIDEPTLRAGDSALAEIALWAARHLPPDTANALKRAIWFLKDNPRPRSHYARELTVGNSPVMNLQRAMRRDQLCTVPLAAEDVLKTLHHPLRDDFEKEINHHFVTRQMAEQLTQQRREIQFDPLLINDPTFRSAYFARVGSSVMDWTSRWETAAKICQQAIQQNHQMGGRTLTWAHDIAGWYHANLAGQSETTDTGTNAAVDHWRNSLRGSMFADQSVRFRTGFANHDFPRFSATQLQRLLPDSSSDVSIWNELNASKTADANRSYWRQYGQTHNSAAVAYESIYRAGWGMPIDSMAIYDPLFEELIASAEQGSWAARAEIARTHHRVFQSLKRS
ncbi:MAG: hypothetical protein AAFP69_00290 [Planctomycetota bacterium]